MKVAVISDSHDDRARFRRAAEIARERQAEAILHCGDIVAPSTLMEAQDCGLPIHAIHGNNTGDLVTLHKVSNRSEGFIHYYGQDAAIELCGRRIFIVHYPHYARAMALTGNYDIICFGHNHRYEVQTVTGINDSETLLLNPGSVAGLDGPASFILIDLQTLAVEKVDID